MLKRIIGYYSANKNRKEAHKVFDEILEIICEGIEEPAGSGCGFGIRESAQGDSFKLFYKHYKG